MLRWLWEVNSVTPIDLPRKSY